MTLPPDFTVPPDLTFEPTALFVGTWLYGAQATLTTNCPGQPPSTDISKSTFDVTRKTLTSVTFSAGAAFNCSFDFSVAGDTATVIPGQMCTITVSGFKAQVAPDMGTMITSDGVSGSLSAHANVLGGLCTAMITAPKAMKM